MVQTAPKSDVRKKKLSFWQALPPYLGGKRKLCPMIFREIDLVVPRSRWRGVTFLDGFFGGGSVSLYAKAQGFHVVCCDIAERSMIVARALIENSRAKIRKEDVIQIVASMKPEQEPGRLEARFVPKVYTTLQARLFDRMLTYVDACKDPARKDLIKLLLVRAMLQCHAMNRPRSGTIQRIETGDFENITPSCVETYIEGMRLARVSTLWEMSERINGGVFLGTGQAISGSTLDHMGGVKASVAYFDPPYPGTFSYEKMYHILDEALEGKVKEVSGFSGDKGVGLLDEIVTKAADIPVWLMSLDNTIIDAGQLEEKVASMGREVKVIEIPFVHWAMAKDEETKMNHRELLVVSWHAGMVEDLRRGR